MSFFKTNFALVQVDEVLCCGAVVECWTCDQEIVGSSLGGAHSVKTLGKFLTPMCLCHQAV